MKFTDNYIKGLKPVTQATRIFEKGADKGFGVVLSVAGSKTFFIQYSASGRRRFLSLGRYPSISLLSAREKCRFYREQIDQGIDPQEKKQASSGSVLQLFEYYVDGMRLSGKKTYKNVHRDLLLNCDSILEIPAADITPSHIKKILHEIIKRGSLVQSNRIRSFLNRAFEVGIFHDNSPMHMSSAVLFNISQNPVALVPKNTAAEKIGERVLSFDELKFLWNYSGSALPRHAHLALKLIIAFGGMRTSEITSAPISEFDMDSLVWSMPPERTKNGRWHLLPITDLCASLVAYQSSFNDSPALFPNRNDKSRPQSATALSHAVKRFCSAENVTAFVAKDLRRTVKTRMGEVGIEKSVRDRIQNHALTDVSSKHYDRWDYLPEKKAALQTWESALRELVIN